ncbi:thioredoxin [Desulfospira joergensenii]|uniref:thioredoxin n=1 Tax=Desulfospira joergensenii TaxID=53329 RepID=UPI0003B38650|nr:thioredoxin [Desulfospira joergensenii]
MNKEEFQSELKGKTVLADFGASWCGPCRAMAPVIRELRDEYAGRTSILEIDIDSQKVLATDYMVQSIPTLILFKDGVEIKRFVGLQSKSTIENSLDAVL